MNPHSGYRNIRLPGLPCILPCMWLLCSSFTLPGAGMNIRAVYARLHVGGGLVVRLGCTDPDALAALRLDDRFLVRAYDRDPARIAAARSRLHALGVYGGISVAELRGAVLPLRDNLVNLLIAPTAMGIPGAELQRVLRPNGVLLLGTGQNRVVVRKPRDAATDDWPHFLYDSTNNAVSRDLKVGPPDAIQWIDNPRWTRSHDFLSSFTVGVSAAGRFIYITDSAPIASVMIPSRWQLVCRDAYNGIILWRKDIPRWFDQFHHMRSGPNYLLRRLAAFDERVAVTLGWTAPVSILDAANGEVLRTLDNTRNASELLYRDGVLYVVVDPDLEKNAAAYYRRWVSRRRPPPIRPESPCRVAAYSSRSGKLLWHRSGDDTLGFQEMTLAVDDSHVCFLTTRALICLKRNDGRLLWKKKWAGIRRRPGWSAPTLVLYRDVVLVGDRITGGTEDAKPENLRRLHEGGAPGRIQAFSLADGTLLWEHPAEDGFHVPIQIFVINDAVWTGRINVPQSPGFVHALNYRTGKVVRQRPPDPSFRAFSTGHNRCHRNKATVRYIITGRESVEFTDVQSGVLTPSIFARGACSFGVLPANGLLYIPPSACMCAWQLKINGMGAFGHTGNAPSPERWKIAVPEPGPGFDAARDLPPPAFKPGDWPTYRHDATRSGVAGCDPGLPLRFCWRNGDAGTQPTAPTAARDRIYFSRPDTPAVVCLDARTGKRRWIFFTDAPVDSPPTLWRGLAIFGCHDGAVHALDALTGKPAWRVRLAPDPKQIPAFGRLESPWPVPGSVLITDDFVYTVAGRSAFLDGGLCLFKINAASGRVVLRRPLIGRVKVKGSENAFLPDILSAGEEGVFFMRSSRFRTADLAPVRRRGVHLWSPTGFLDDSWMHRTYWLYGSDYGRTWTLRKKEMPVPAGRLICVDRDAGIAFCFGQNRYEWGIRPERWRSGVIHFQVSAVPVSPSGAAGIPPPDTRAIRRGAALARRSLWTAAPGIEARSMAVTPNYILVAGPAGNTVFSDGAFHGRDGVKLLVLDRRTGDELEETTLPAVPVFDGLIVAAGRVLLTLRDGSVICFGAGR